MTKLSILFPLYTILNYLVTIMKSMKVVSCSYQLQGIVPAH